MFLIREFQAKLLIREVFIQGLIRNGRGLLSLSTIRKYPLSLIVTISRVVCIYIHYHLTSTKQQGSGICQIIFLSACLFMLFWVRMQLPDPRVPLPVPTFTSRAITSTHVQFELCDPTSKQTFAINKGARSSKSTAHFQTFYLCKSRISYL